MKRTSCFLVVLSTVIAAGRAQAQTTTVIQINGVECTRVNPDSPGSAQFSYSELGIVNNATFRNIVLCPLTRASADSSPTFKPAINNVFVYMQNTTAANRADFVCRVKYQSNLFGESVQLTTLEFDSSFPQHNRLRLPSGGSISSSQLANSVGEYLECLIPAKAGLLGIVAEETTQKPTSGASFAKDPGTPGTYDNPWF